MFGHGITITDPAGLGTFLIGSKQVLEINEKSVTMGVVRETNFSSTEQSEEVSLSLAGHSSSCNIPSTAVCSCTDKIDGKRGGGTGKERLTCTTLITNN